MKKTIRYIFASVFIIYSLYTFLSLDLRNVEIYMIDNLLISNLLLTLFIVIYCITGGLKKYFSLFGFVCSFAVFNFGSFIFDIGTNNYGIHIFHTINYISNYNIARCLIITYIAMLTFFLFYSFSAHVTKMSISQFNDINKLDVITLRKITKLLMFIGFIFASIKLAKEILFVFNYGYNAYYLTLSYNNPFIDLFDGFYYIGFYGYISTMPEKKELKIPTIIFIIFSISTLLMGKRGIFLINILTVLWFYIKYDVSINISTKIFTKRKIIVMIVIMLIIFGFMYQFQDIRVKKYDTNFDIIDNIIGFMDSMGFTGRTLALSMEYEHNLKSFSSFNKLFNPIIRYIKNNSIVRAFGGGYSTLQDSSILNEVGTFSGMLTYYSNPVAFAKGGGVGSNYLAELYSSYGIICLVLFNVALGYMLLKLDRFNSSDWQKRFIMMYIFNSLLFMPRSEALGIIPNLVLPFIISSVIFMICKKKRKEVL